MHAPDVWLIAAAILAAVLGIIAKGKWGWGRMFCVVMAIYGAILIIQIGRMIAK